MAIDRYSRDDEGFRKYVMLLESTPVKKREIFLESARAENRNFADTAERYVLTFDRICRLPEMELTEVLAASEIKLDLLAVAVASAEENQKNFLLGSMPKPTLAKVQMLLREITAPDALTVGGARLHLIQVARGQEAQGKLQSVQIPRFGVGHFLK